MHRTNLYLTEEQERELDARARSERISRSELVRRILDRELARPKIPDPELEAAFGSMADSYHEAVGDLFDDDPDLRVER